MSLGSCRLFHPLTVLDKVGTVELVREGLWLHVHQPPEQLQQIAWLRGEFEPPEELYPVIAGPSFNGRKGSLDGIDVLVVEISSFKLYTLDNWVLHGTYAYNWLRDAGLKDWARDLKMGRLPDDRSTYLTESLTPVQRSVVMGARRSVLTEAQIHRGMKQLRDSFDGVLLFATHWETRDENGELVADRRRLIETVEAGASTLGCRCFNPTSLIAKHGDEKALMDRNHYAEGFYAVAANAMLDEIELAVAAG